jgi:antirestriction protein ArdC
MAEKTPIKEQIKKLTDQIEAGIKALFQSGDLEKYQAYLRTMSHFHHYSVNNQMLIFSQCPHATLVAGYQKWQNQFSRHVLRGEKGISILAPTPYKIKVEKEKLDPVTKLPLLDADGNTITEEKEVQIPMFRPVKVFDVSQTDGKPLPERVQSPVAELTGNVEHYEAFMEALRRVSPVPIEMKPLSNDLDGFFSPSKQSITLRAGMSEVQTVCAAVHEIAHSKLHDYAKQPNSQPKDSNTEEIEAESIAYTVCAYFGIETSANSFGYVATWSKDKDVKAFRASLDTIRKTSSELISGVDQHFKEICKERGISLEPEKPAQEQDTEKLYMVDNEKYIHVQRSDNGIDYTIYDAGSAKALDGGVLEDSGQPLSAAALTVCKLHDIGATAPIRLAPLEILENLQDANEIAPRAAAEAPSDTPLPETPEIVHDVQETAPVLTAPPDPSMSIAAMRAFGYMDADMLPLSKERALELMEHDATVYMLFAENSEAMAFEPEDIAMHTGMFGITREDWNAIKASVPVMDSGIVQKKLEQAFLESPTDSFAIFQLKRGDEHVALRFLNMASLQKNGLSAEKANYDLIYTGTLPQANDLPSTLEGLYVTFNQDRPEDFCGHSLSVSDIVAVKRGGVVSCHYLDSVGYQELPAFWTPENYLKNAEMQLEDDYGMIDGIINNGPKEQPKTQEPERGADNLQKRPSVLARLRAPLPCQEKNVRKHAERDLE